jgi:hypothetical protein
MALGRGAIASRLAERLLSGPLPRGERVGDRSRLREVMSHRLGLCLPQLRKLRRQYLGTALMVLLPGPLQQGLIGRILDAGVLEEIDRHRELAALALWRARPGGMERPPIGLVRLGSRREAGQGRATGPTERHPRRRLTTTARAAHRRLLPHVRPRGGMRRGRQERWACEYARGGPLSSDNRWRAIEAR